MAVKLINVTVTAKVNKFRRAGYVWTSTPIDADVTPEELKILQLEPMLFVVVNSPAAAGAKNEAV